MKQTIRIVGLINGQPTTFDGQYLVEYDPGRDGIDPGTGLPMYAHIVTTPDIERATKYEGMAAFEVWRMTDPRQPLRADGKPNRPLTAFTVMIDNYEED